MLVPNCSEQSRSLSNSHVQRESIYACCYVVLIFSKHVSDSLNDLFCVCFIAANDVFSAQNCFSLLKAGGQRYTPAALLPRKRPGIGCVEAGWTPGLV